jgi:hypothetical protein
MAVETRQQLLEEVVFALQNVRPGTGLKRTAAVGEVILKLLFGGDPAAWHSQRRNKAESLRGLARTKGCTMSRSALSQAVAVYVSTAGLALDDLQHIQSSHVIAVWGLAPEVRQRLLQEAERERYSVRALRQHAAGLRRSTNPPPAGPASSRRPEIGGGTTLASSTAS